ncbi:MAG: hypothetical protein DSY80_11210 [Desulfocapsa sp.]|nr:MAG: hypothetical protein DSY80_11210 [Desulfocapsa sp.]
MKKGIVAVVLSLAFAASTVVAIAGTTKCTVDSVDGAKVTMTCKGAKFAAGDAVKVKAAKKKAAAIEGC